MARGVIHPNAKVRLMAVSTLRAMLPLMLLALFAAGCGRSDGRRPMTGSVTFNGQPVESGEIIFRAADGARASDAGQIVAGRYALRASEGKKRVEITAMREVQTTQAASGEPPVSFKSYIPAKYNEKSELTIEVTAGGPDTHDFTLTP
ncbi:MAG: hypothetical protein U1E05_24650 [Patescibacteria group bacterium]|nr:hypothetical protein [Patescibacteria group bacterium]